MNIELSKDWLCWMIGVQFYSIKFMTDPTMYCTTLYLLCFNITFVIHGRKKCQY